MQTNAAPKASSSGKARATAKETPARPLGAHGQCAVPTEKEVEEGLARMRPEVRKAFEESLDQYGEVYKKLADM